MPKERQTGMGVDRSTKQRIFRRTTVLMVLFGVLTFLPLAAKLYEIQITNHDLYEERAINQQTSEVPVSASRGAIYDAKGNLLAISATAHTLIISPKDIKANKLDETLIAEGLAEILERDAETIAKRLERTGSQYEIIATKLEEDKTKVVREFISTNKLAGGVYLEPDSKRYYPYASLASHVIGFTGTDNAGQYGLEALYEKELAGVSGRVITARNGVGTELLYRYENYIDAQDGNSLNLTIDATIQSICERVLAEGIEAFEVRKGGFAIAMNPKTGAILGLASSPEYDLNAPRTIADADLAALFAEMRDDPAVTEEDYLAQLGAAQHSQWRNKAINDTYEPGSTFKAMVVAAALEDGVVSADDRFFCSGAVVVAGHEIHCHKHTGHGSQNLTEAVMNSCNPAFIAIGQKIGAERFYQYLQDYGFLGLTGIDLQGEAGSIIWDKKLFTSEEGIASLAVAAFGQTLKVTPIQVITAAASVVNGGHLMQPYILQSVTAADGTVLQNHAPVQVRQVISQEVSEQVRGMLEAVVGSGGTGKNAYVAGYRIGGKTGTSQKRDETTGDLIVSFLGFAPADDPEVIILLAYDSPTPVSAGSTYTKGGWYISGGNMAATMAGELLGDILDYMGVEKQYTGDELSGADTIVPRVTGYYLSDAVSMLKSKGLSYRKVGDGEIVTAQIPAQGASIPGGSQVVLYMGADVPQGQVEVPDLSGKTPEAAAQALANMGLYIRVTGSMEYFTSSTSATSQSILPGSPVDRGTVVEVRFVDSVSDFTRN